MKKSNTFSTRRSFLKKSVAASSFFIVPRFVLGGNGYTAPSDKLSIASIGCGGKGSSDISHASVNGRENVVALCDIHPTGDHGVINIRKRFPKAKFYTDFRELLSEEKGLDAVTISTPDHTHGIIAKTAMEKKIHVYVQKPLTHNIKEARLLTELARKKKVVTQMGNQGASHPGQKFVQQWIREKRIGNISEVKVWTNRPVWPQGISFPSSDPENKPKGLDWDSWLGPAKKIPYNSSLHPFNWRGWWDYGTGSLGDMGCHLIDIPFRALKLKYPVSVECSVSSFFSKMWEVKHQSIGCPASSYVTINFEPTLMNKTPIKLEWYDGGLRPSYPSLIPSDTYLGGKRNTNGVMMIGEEGIITTNVYGQNPRLFTKDKEVISPKIKNLPKDDWGHQRMWINAIKDGYGSPKHKMLTSSFDYAGPMTETVLMGNIAIRSYLLNTNGNPESVRITGKNKNSYYGRRKMTWDGENMKITNFEDANQFVGRSYREGWEL